MLFLRWSIIKLYLSSLSSWSTLLYGFTTIKVGPQKQWIKFFLYLISKCFNNSASFNIGISAKSDTNLWSGSLSWIKWPYTSLSVSESDILTFNIFYSWSATVIVPSKYSNTSIYYLSHTSIHTNYPFFVHKGIFDCEFIYKRKIEFFVIKKLILKWGF